MIGSDLGQLLVSNAQLARRIYSERPKNLTNTAELDQDYADTIIRGNTSQFTYCPMTSSFAAQCWVIKKYKSQVLNGVALPPPPMTPLCKRVTHHFNCVTTRKAKGDEMRAMIQEYRTKCPSMLLG